MLFFWHVPLCGWYPHDDMTTNKTVDLGSRLGYSRNKVEKIIRSKIQFFYRYVPETSVNKSQRLFYSLFHNKIL